MACGSSSSRTCRSSIPCIPADGPSFSSTSRIQVDRKGSTPNTSNKLRNKVTQTSSNVKYSRAFLTHNFQRKLFSIRSPNLCLFCPEKATFTLYECSNCKLYGHKNCLLTTLIRCGPRHCISNPLSTPTFGTYLTELIEDLPVIIYRGVTELEIRGYISIQFVYLARGEEAEITKLKEAFDLAPKLVDLTEVAYFNIGELIKRFFTELKCPVISQGVRCKMMDVIRMLPHIPIPELDENQWKELRRIVRRKMPKSHAYTLNYFILHLKRLSNKSHLTEMSSADLAEIFGPILCGHSGLTCMDAKVVEDKHLIRILISNARLIFDDKHP